MLTDDEVTSLQLALEKSDVQKVQELLRNQTGDDLTGLQIFAEHTLLMYACEHSSPQVVEFLLSKGTHVEELEWSANNELKSVLRNQEHRNEILPLVLKVIPKDISAEMIATDWDPDGLSQGEARSPLDMARELEDQSCFKLLNRP
jgi:ankyrin repeat protein